MKIIVHQMTVVGRVRFSLCSATEKRTLARLKAKSRRDLRRQTLAGTWEFSLAPKKEKGVD